jgi:hypothetical protein
MSRQRRFARTVCADHSNILSFGYAQVDAAQRWQHPGFAIGMSVVQIINLDQYTHVKNSNMIFSGSRNAFH